MNIGDQVSSLPTVRLLLALVFFLFTRSRDGAHSQGSNQIFERLTTEQGLSSNKVEAVIQDREGFYWIATQNGLNRFDGTAFKIFTHNANDSTSIPNNRCISLLEDQQSDIWVVTHTGLCRYIKSKGHFQAITLPNTPSGFKSGNKVTNLALDKNGDVWIGGAGLWKYDVHSDQITLYQNNEQFPDSIKLYSHTTHLTYDEINHGLWFSGGNEMFFFSISDYVFHYRDNNPKQWKIFEQADGYEMTLDHVGRVWFRDRKTQCLSFFDSSNNTVTVTRKKVDSGIRRIVADEKNRIWILYWVIRTEILDPVSFIADTGFFSIQHRRSVLSEYATSLFVDKQKNYWITSGNGISIYNESNQYYKLHRVQMDQYQAHKESIRIHAIAQTNPGFLWLGTNEGLFQYQLETGKIVKIKVDLPHPKLNSLLADQDRLWMCTYDQLICLDANTQAVIQRIVLSPGLYFIRKCNDQELWVGLWAGGLFKVNTQTGLHQHFAKDESNEQSLKANYLITGYAEQDGIWVGYNGGIGFSSYTFQDHTWTHFNPEKKGVLNSSLATITSITKTEKNQMWLGTHGGGIFQFDPVGPQYKIYTQNEGLLSNYINSIVPDSAGQLWISTADGLNYMDTESNRIRSLNIDLVFMDNDFVANGIKGMNGNLYFFCNTEFVEINPRFYNPDHTFPKLVISSFTIFDKDQIPPQQFQHIPLSYRENYFSFGFSAIKTHPLKKANYTYILEGFDQDWIMTSVPYASYTNVPDGNYLFKVRTTNDEGVWSEPLLNIPLHIKPPYWRTWWFVTLCIIGLTSGAYLFYRYRIQQIKKLFAVRTKISQNLHDEVGSTLSSIHVYSSVAAKALQSNPEAAKDALQQIKQNSREAMENMSDIVWAINIGSNGQMSFEDKIKNYGYELLTPLGINCHYDIDKEAEKKLVNIEARKNVLLIVKESMNNIAKYSAATEASFQLGMSNGYLQLNIKDNGRGFNLNNMRQGNGLYNMKQRTETLGGKFQLQSAETKGTTLKCEIPLPNISDTWTGEHP